MNGRNIDLPQIRRRVLELKEVNEKGAVILSTDALMELANQIFPKDSDEILLLKKELEPGQPPYAKV